MVVEYRIVEMGSRTVIDCYPIADLDYRAVLADVERAVSRLQASHPDKEFRIDYIE